MPMLESMPTSQPGVDFCGCAQGRQNLHEGEKLQNRAFLTGVELQLASIWTYQVLTL